MKLLLILLPLLASNLCYGQLRGVVKDARSGEVLRKAKVVAGEQAIVCPPPVPLPPSPSHHHDHAGRASRTSNQQIWLPGEDPQSYFRIYDIGQANPHRIFTLTTIRRLAVGKSR